MPVMLRDGRFLGTLCAIDPGRREASLMDERRTAESRDQGIAGLGHDLRNPLASISSGTRFVFRMPLTA